MSETERSSKYRRHFWTAFHVVHLIFTLIMFCLTVSVLAKHKTSNNGPRQPVTEQLRSIKYSMIINNNSAHVVLGKNAVNPDSHILTPWTHRGQLDEAYVRSGITNYQNGTLQLMTPGDWDISLTIAKKLPSSYIVFDVQLVLLRHGSPNVLKRKINRLHPDRIRDNISYDSIQLTVLGLPMRKNDMLYIWVSHPNLVVRDPAETYFSLRKI